MREYKILFIIGATVFRGHIIIPMVILSLPLIQIGQSLDVHKVLVNCLGLRLLSKRVDRLTDRLDTNNVVDGDVKQHSNEPLSPYEFTLFQ